MRLTRKTRSLRPSPDELMPPEGVPLHLPVAGIGVRMAAQLTDILITFLGALAVLLLLYLLDLVEPQTFPAIATLLFFLIRIPYYVLGELAWNGQTLGKRFMKIKVVAHDGGPLTTQALVLRNIMKEAEVFLPGTLLMTLDTASPVTSWLALGWVVATLLVPLLNRHRRRLGDLMAGTHVIHLPQPILLKDLAQSTLVPMVADAKPFTFLAHQLDHYGAYELQTLEQLLRAQDTPRDARAALEQRATLASVVDRIRKKIGFAEPVPAADHVRFLAAFYKAQRAHLEQRQLFGDRRSDKHHAQAETRP